MLNCGKGQLICLVTNHPQNGCTVIRSIVNRYFDSKSLKIKREDIWWETFCFCKILMEE